MYSAQNTTQAIVHNVLANVDLNVVSESLGSHHKEPIKWNLSTPSNSNTQYPILNISQTQLLFKHF